MKQISMSPAGYFDKGKKTRRERLLAEMEQRRDLSDPDAEKALYDSITKRRFASASTDADIIPHETSIVNFRRLLERH